MICEKKNKIYLLKKILYKLNQTPKTWYSRINDYIISFGFQKSFSKTTLYVKKNNNNILIISFYIDDLLMTWRDVQQVEEFKQKIMQTF
jgi:hypothetical protein